MAVQPTITRPTLPAAEHLIPRENGYGVHEVAPSPSASFADPWVVRELHSCGIAHPRCGCATARGWSVRSSFRV